MLAPLIIIGAGGHGAEVLAYARDMCLPVAGAFDDGKTSAPWLSTQIIGGLDLLPAFCDGKAKVEYLTAFGSNQVRQRMVERVEAFGLSNLRPATVIHGTVWTGAMVRIGAGTLLAPGALVTTCVTIGRHCIVNVKASISHDCVIGDFCNINPDATLCGNVEVGDGVFIGAGAVVKERICIGANAVIGAGAVVIHDVPPNTTVAGVPARGIRLKHGLDS